MLPRINRIVVPRLRLSPLFIHNNAYSTAPVSAKEPVTHELETAEQKELRMKQAPNRTKTWSASQRRRSEAFDHPRFEGAILQMQPQSAAAIELIAEQPIRYVNERIAVCDGGGGPRGHPKIFINVDKPGSHPCGYCGLRYAASRGKHEVLPTMGAV